MKKIFQNLTSNKFLVPFLLLFMFFVMVTSMAGDSAVRDEMPHIVSGYSYLKTGDYRLNPEHPPLIKDLAGFPLLFINPKLPTNHFERPLNDQWAEGEAFLYKEGNNPDQLLFWGRMSIILLSILLGYFVYRWARELYGKKAGLFALTLYAFDANIIAHSRFITTDLGIAAMVFINLYFLWKFMEEPSKKRLLWVAITLAIALLTKFSAPILIITYAIVALYFILRRRAFEKGSLLFTRFFNADSLKRFLGFLFAFLAAGLLALVIVWFVYALQTINMPKDIFHQSVDVLENPAYKNILHKMVDIPVLRPLAHYITGFLMVGQHATGGHTAFLLGQISTGWWYYYIVVFFVKTAIPTMIFIAISIIFWIGMKDKDKNHKAKIVLLAPVFIFIAFTLSTKLNLGIRYLLPMFPLLYVFISFLAEKVSLKDLKELASKKVNFDTIFSLVFFLLIGWYIISSVQVYPYYLTYFNEAVGGSKNGMRYLTDSNLDWGQDLKRLVQYTERNKIDRIRVDYFGGGSPEYYLKDKYISWNENKTPESGYYAISATYFQQSRAQNRYDWLKDKKPLTTIGHSILIFKN